VDEGPTGGEDPTLVAMNRHDGAHGPGHLVIANQAQTTGVGDPTAKDPTGKDVHSQQLIPASVPAKTFAEHSLIARGGYRVAHDPTSCGKGTVMFVAS
jgi:hypothetical protein